MADISFTFTGDASSLKKAFDDIKAELANTRNAVAGLSTQFANAYIAVKGAVEAIKGAFQAVSGIPEQSAGIEAMSAGFAVLVGAAAQAGDALREVWERSRPAASGLEAVRAAAQPLVSVLGNSKSIEEWTRRFADISVGSGVAADALARVFARVQTLGRADVGSLDGLARQGLPVYEELGAVMRVTAEDARRLVEEGNVGATRYSAAMRRMTMEGGRYHEASAKLEEAGARVSGAAVSAQAAGEAMSASVQEGVEQETSALDTLCSWFMGNANAAKKAAASAREFARALEGLERQAGKVKTQEQYASFMEELQDRIDGLQGQRDDAAAEGEDERAEQLAAQVDELEEQRARYERILPLQIRSAQEEQRRTEELRRQAEEAAELEKKLEDARKKMDDLVARQHEHGREAYLSGLGDTKAEIDIRLSDAGFKTIEDLEREIARLEKLGGEIEAEDVCRYERLCAVYNKLIDLKHKDAEETRKAADEEARRGEVAAKRQQEVALNQQEYDMRAKMLRAEISGHQQRIIALKAQQRIAELTLEYQREGLADAEAAARRMTALEMQAEERRALSNWDGEGRRRDSGTRISSSLASVGGGGRSILIGGPLVTETKKHTKLLEAIKVATSQKPTVQVSGNVEAVIGR